MKFSPFQFHWLLLFVGSFCFDPSILNSQQTSNDYFVYGIAKKIATEFEQSTALGVSPNGHVFGSASNRLSSNPSAFSYDGKTKRLISPLAEYKEFHALDASDNGIVVGYSFVKNQRSTAPISLPTIFDHKMGTTMPLCNELGQATGISAAGDKIVGNIKGHPTFWFQTSDGKWSSQELKGPSKETITVSRVSISPNGSLVAASGSFGNRRSRSLYWNLEEDEKWTSIECQQGSEVFFAVEQVNDHGWRIGTYTKANGKNIAALLMPGKKIISIGGHNPSAHSFGRDINNDGTALVYSYHKEEQVSFLYKDKKQSKILIGDANDSVRQSNSILAKGLTDLQTIVGAIDSDSPNVFNAVVLKPIDQHSQSKK